MFSFSIPATVCMTYFVNFTLAIIIGWVLMDNSCFIMYIAIAYNVASKGGSYMEHNLIV